MSVDDAKAIIFERDTFLKGSLCPCCGQNVQLYERSANSRSCLALIDLYKIQKEEGAKDFVHVKRLKYSDGGGDFAKLRYFGLIEEKPNNNDKKKKKRTSGYWTITIKGIGFVEREVNIPEYVEVFDSKVYGFKGKEVGIEEALGNEFNYGELMRFKNVEN